MRLDRPLALLERARDMPIVVGREADVAAHGAFFTTDALGVPLLVTRDHGGVVHAMVNACRHRGSRVVYEARGTAESFICPSHAWQYDLCGVMGTLPLSRCRPGGVREDSALVALPCEVRHGLVWVVPNRRARIDVAAFLGPLDETLARARVEAEAPLDIEPNATLARDGDRVVLVGRFPRIDGSIEEIAFPLG